MSVCIIKKDHPLYDFYLWLYSKDWIADSGASLEGVRLEDIRKPHRRTQPMLPRKPKPRPQYLLPVGVKICSKCGRELPFEEFHKAKDGRMQARCKACMREDCKEYYKRKMAKRKGEQPPPRKKNTKVCAQCGERKPQGEFYGKGAGKGLQKVCRACEAKRRADLLATIKPIVIIEERHTNQELRLELSKEMEQFKKEIVYYGDDCGRAE